MEIQLALDPSLAVAPDQFAATWNEDPACRRVAAAQAQPGPVGTFDPLAVSMLTLLVVPLAVGLATNALYDLIKDVLVKQGVHRRTQIIRQRLPDGSELLVITIDEQG